MEGDTTPLEKIPLDWIGHFQEYAAYLGSRLSTHKYATAQWMAESLWLRGYTGAVSYEARESTGGIKEYRWGLRQFMNLLETAHSNRNQSQS